LRLSYVIGAFGAMTFIGCMPKPLVRATGQLSPVKVSISPFESAVHIRRLRYIKGASKEIPKEQESSLVQQEMNRIKLILAEDFAARISSTPFFVATSTMDAEIEADVTLEAYGRVPAKWLAILVGSGVVEAAFQGVVFAKATGNKWVAIGIASEETASEGLTWLGGAFLTNRYLTPVIFSCRVVRKRDHKTIWSKHVFRLYSRKTIASLPPMERNDRAAQLRAVADKALDDLTKAFTKAGPKIIKAVS
jgi:hypothetical protein